MTYLTEKQKGFREAVIVVEIDLDINDPNIDFSGDANSYNTPKTTNDLNAYNGTTQTYIFTNQQLDVKETHYPILESVTSTPATLKVGEDVAASASASITLNDIESNDVFELPPPYDDRRVTGSFLGKLIARNYLENRVVRVKRGYNPSSLDDSNFQIEHYVVKTFSDPNNNGVMTISLIDRLFFSTASKAKAPVVSDVRLNTVMTTSNTNISFSGTLLGDKGTSVLITNGDVGYIAIGKEIMSYTITSYNGSSGSMTVVRAQGGSLAEEHELLDTIQGCFYTQSAPNVFGAENITDVNRRLLLDYSNIGAQFIDDIVWDAEKSGNLSEFNFTNIIPKPTEVKKLLKQTIQSSASWMYFDIIQNELLIGATARFDEPVITLNESENILENSLKINNVDAKQTTRQSIFFGKRNFTENEDERNFANSFQKFDTLAEDESQYDQINESPEIKSNWLTGSTTDVNVASSIPQIKVERFRDTPKSITMNLDSVNVGDLSNGKRLWYGSPVEIISRQRLNPDGTQATTLAQIISVKPTSIEDTWSVTALSYAANIPTSADLIIDENQVDYDLGANLVTDEAREYIVIINSGVRITASGTGVYAFDQGAFFAGATLRLVNQGFIVAAGGFGGNGGARDEPEPTPPFPPTDGGNGGNALNLTTDTVLDNLTGLIGGGGGGGGAGASNITVDSGGGGGGGGAGDTGGNGGAGGNLAEGGEDGSFDFAGDGGLGDNGGNDGKKGGDLGEDGIDGDSDGGFAGDAIHTNGNSLIIEGGDNASQIKGAIV